jgi:hypothetical protein
MRVRAWSAVRERPRRARASTASTTKRCALVVIAPPWDASTAPRVPPPGSAGSRGHDAAEGPGGASDAWSWTRTRTDWLRTRAPSGAGTAALASHETDATFEGCEVSPGGAARTSNAMSVGASGTVHCLTASCAWISKGRPSASTSMRVRELAGQRARPLRAAPPRLLAQNSR